LLGSSVENLAVVGALDRGVETALVLLRVLILGHDPGGIAVTGEEVVGSWESRVGSQQLVEPGIA